MSTLVRIYGFMDNKNSIIKLKHFSGLYEVGINLIMMPEGKKKTKI